MYIALVLHARTTFCSKQVPFIFKDLVDTLSESSQAASAAAMATAGSPSDAIVAVPIALVLGYGIARSTASGATEVRIHHYLAGAYFAEIWISENFQIFEMVI